MQKFYLVPVEVIDGIRAPRYFWWRLNPSGIQGRWSAMDYGFLPTMLVLAHNISQADHDGLILNADVYSFPDNLDQPVTDPGIDTFLETLNIPTDWLTPSTTYRELLRQLAGMFVFNQRYHGIAAAATGEQHSIFDNGRTLDDNWNSLSAAEKQWFNDTVHSFGFPQNVVGNPKLRTLTKQAGDLWGAQPFYMGGVAF